MDRRRDESPSDLQGCLWLFLLACALYVQTLSFGYTHLDDGILILGDYERLRRWSYALQAFREHTFQVLRDGAAVFYRPLLTVSFVWDAHVWRIAPFASAFGFHLTNVLLHGACSALVFLLLVRVGCERRLSLLGAALFAVHPALSQAVAWIPGRNDTLLGVLAIASFLAFVEFQASGKRRWLFGHGVLWLGALLTKESAVVLPALCLLYQRLLARRSRPAWTAWAACAAVWLWLRQQAMGPAAGAHLGGRLAVAARAALPQTLYFAGRALLPFNPGALSDPSSVGLGWGVAAVVLLAAGLALARERRNALLLFGASWALLFLAPTFLALPSYRVPLEQRLYVPMAGLLVVALEIARGVPALRRRAAVVFVPVIAAFAALAVRQSLAFKDPIRFWQAAVQMAPESSMTHQSLAGALGESGRWEQAAGELKQAIALEPEPSEKGHQSLGVAYTKLGDWTSARAEFLRALSINPLSEPAHFGLATVDYEDKAFSAADAEWLRALRLNPDDALDDLTVCYFVDRRRRQALRYLSLTESSGLAADPRLGARLASLEAMMEKDRL